MQIAAQSHHSVSQAPRSILARGYVAQLKLKGVKKLTVSHLKEVEKLDRAYEEARAEIDALPGSLVSQALAGAR